MGATTVNVHNFLYTLVVLICISIFSESTEINNKTTGKCSPIISGDISGDLILKCYDEDIMPFFFLDLSCKSYYHKEKNPDSAITEFYKFLKNNNGRVVVIEFLQSPATFCTNIEGLPSINVVNRFKATGEYYSLKEHQTFVYRNKQDYFFRFKITPEDPHSKKTAKLSAKLTNDCGHACAHWRLVGIPSTSYISGDGSDFAVLDIAPREIMFSERYLETMDEVDRLKKVMSKKNYFYFSKIK